MFEFRLPDIGEGLSEGELLQWHVKIGDAVKEGEDLASISTDKVAVVLPAPRAGVIAALHWKAGDVIPVGAVLLQIDDGAHSEAILPAHARPKPYGEAAHPAVTPASVPGTSANDAPLKAGPAVRAYAKAQGVNLAAVNASGPTGEILRKDIDAFLAAEASKNEPRHSGTVTVERLTKAGLVAANRLAESSRSLATTTLTFEVTARGVLRTAEQLTEEASRHGIRVGPLPVIAKRTATALAKHPRFNATLGEDSTELHLHDDVHLGIAVDTAGGLLVPVIRNAQAKSIVSIALEIAVITQRARADKLLAADLQGSTFTISSTGGIERATMLSTTPIVNIPNVATLWISRINQRPWVVDGAVVGLPVMMCSLSFDHRFIHGAHGMAFVNELDALFQSTSTD